MARKSIPEASYIVLARKLVEVKLALKAATHSKKSLERLVANAMHAVGISSFKFMRGEQKYKTTLHRPTVQAVCLQKLYTAVRAEEITLDEFLRCVEPNNETVLETFGQDFFDKVTTYERGPLSLTISLVAE